MNLQRRGADRAQQGEVAPAPLDRQRQGARDDEQGDQDRRARERRADRDERGPRRTGIQEFCGAAVGAGMCGDAGNALADLSCQIVGRDAVAGEHPDDVGIRTAGRQGGCCVVGQEDVIGSVGLGVRRGFDGPDHAVVGVDAAVAEGDDCAPRDACTQGRIDDELIGRLGGATAGDPVRSEACGAPGVRFDR